MTGIFKIGDRVRIKDTKTSPHTPRCYVGLVGAVTQVRTVGPFEYRVLCDGFEPGDIGDLFKLDELEAI